MTEQERPRTEADVWAAAGVTELQRMRLAQHGYRIARTEAVEAARIEGRQQAVPLLESLRFWLWNRRNIANPPPENIDLRIQEIDAWLAGLNASESPPTYADAFADGWDAAGGEPWPRDASESGQPPESSDE